MVGQKMDTEKEKCRRRKRLKDQQLKLQVQIPKQEKVKSFLKNLLRPDLLSMIKYFLIILLLTGCAVDRKHSERWITSLKTLPRVEGYVVTGIFELGKNLYAQHCDSKGNQQWLRYKEETHSWKKGKYVTGGCAGWND